MLPAAILLLAAAAPPRALVPAKEDARSRPKASHEKHSTTIKCSQGQLCVGLGCSFGKNVDVLQTPNADCTSQWAPSTMPYTYDTSTCHGCHCTNPAATWPIKTPTSCSTTVVASRENEQPHEGLGTL